VLPQLAERITDFKPSLIRRVTKDTSLETLKAFSEATGILDAANYPAHLPELVPLSTWLGKALAAREAAINYFKEAKNKTLETVI
jgi:hypothetical protein